MSYEINLLVRVEKGGGQPQLVSRFADALRVSGVKIQPGVYGVTVERAKDQTVEVPSEDEAGKLRELCAKVATWLPAQCSARVALEEAAQEGQS